MMGGVETGGGGRTHTCLAANNIHWSPFRRALRQAQGRLLRYFDELRTGCFDSPSTGSGLAPSTGSWQAPSTGSGQAPSTSGLYCLFILRLIFCFTIHPRFDTSAQAFQRLTAWFDILRRGAWGGAL